MSELTATGIQLYGRGELEAAERAFREAVRNAPLDIGRWKNLAAVLLHQKKYAAALPVVAHMVELKPDLAEAHFDLGTCYNRLGRNGDAIRSYETAIALKPDWHVAHAHVVNAYLDGCEWDCVDRWREAFDLSMTRLPPESWAQRIQPFVSLMLLPRDVAKQVAVLHAAAIVKAVGTPDGAPRTMSTRRSRDKIRVGYVSADFNQHATAELTYSLYECHDRRRFEVYGYSIGPNDHGEYRKHIESTCDRFFDVREESEERIAARLRADEIDVLVDMKGYTDGHRMGIFARRAAPVQISYLAYPGTTGADFFDYFISDAIATPPGTEDEFTENLVYMPHTYQVNHGAQPAPAGRGVSRSAHHLPEDAFVFCDFNQARKIDRRIFGVWMSILRRVPKGVLWLLRPDELAEANLRKYARQQGVDPVRLVFAEPVAKSLHVARFGLADLFLDTLICNAHTGASDALWAGVPLLTCPGARFSARVAASILHAGGLPELVAGDLSAYEELAVGLASDPRQLALLKRRLHERRSSSPLFDTGRYVRNLETAYERMHELRCRGKPPQTLHITER